MHDLFTHIYLSKFCKYIPGFSVSTVYLCRSVWGSEESRGETKHPVVAPATEVYHGNRQTQQCGGQTTSETCWHLVSQPRLVCLYTEWVWSVILTLRYWRNDGIDVTMIIRRIEFFNAENYEYDCSCTAHSDYLKSRSDASCILQFIYQCRFRFIILIMALWNVTFCM